MGPSTAALRASAQDDKSSTEHDDFVERAFAKSAEYLRDRYASIGGAAQFYTKLAGVSFEGRQDVIAGLPGGAPLELRRQPENEYDANAIAVYYGALQLGFIKKGIARHIAPLIDEGERYNASVASITGGDEKHLGVNVFVERDVAAVLAARDRTHAAARTLWDATTSPEQTAGRIRAALIGDAVPHDAQRAVLERVESGKNTLALLGTGRGKSFCFQYVAATRALAANAKTLVVYPLRALANDQYHGLNQKLDPLGIRVYKANGSIGNDEREELFAALRDGSWDVVLATPEFLEFHCEAFSGPSAPQLLVVDEAHHLFESRHRPAYAHFRETIERLGRPQVLALTATADEAFRKIVDDLAIEAWVIDPTVRENLRVVDARGKNKEAYLADVLAEPGKAIVYTNSRTEATKIAQGLRKRLGNEVMFYHAGMPAHERHDTERFFREGALRVVVATSAFGEGIDLPDVRNVVLYHLNFDFAEFNQQAGRAGRDGAPAAVHLLYGEKDRNINDYLIDLDAPSLGTLRAIYRGLRGLARDGVLRTGNADLAATLDLDKVRDRTVAAALRIFGDSGLAETGEDDDGRYVRLLEVDGRVDMERNERFAEGQATRESFALFASMALTASAETLERIINRPIYPSRVQLLR
ncbi:MAG: DEAD/DEAH box helicase [Candidatus Eremiobacteraeota bacterium]|nr:DEAD/DEAH box helicase [Candidatus Eremiobacteraeota bacterium]